MSDPNLDCARARLLVSDLTQILRDTAHTLQAHHNIDAATWLLAVLEQLEQHRQLVLNACQSAPMLPPWEAPTLNSLKRFMDGVDMHATPATLKPLLQAVVDELTQWFEQHPYLPDQPELMASLHKLIWPPLPNMPEIPGDPLAPINEEGS